MNLPDFEQVPRAVAIDLDGTLLNSRTQLSARSHSALEQCIARDIPVIIATSRPARIFKRIFPQDLAVRCSFALMNGAVTSGNPPLSGYLKETLPEELTRRIINIAIRFHTDIGITIEIDGYDFGANWISDTDMLWERNSATPDMLFSIDEAISRQPCKIALGGQGIDILKLADELRHSLGDTISIVPALLGIPLLNITTPEATKPVALQKLLKPAGIPLEQVIAFGDDIPDIEMLKACGTAVAVDNAFPEVKSICAYHTASNDEDGVALVLEKMLAV